MRAIRDVLAGRAGSQRSRLDDSGALMPRYVEDDWSLLHPYFRAKLEALFDAMREDGYDPHLADGYRTPAQSGALQGTGKSNLRGLSMHCFGIAADVICHEHGWGCAGAMCGFFGVLDKHARARGFTRVRLTGKDGKPYLDLPHVQGVPVAVQDVVRKGLSPDQLEALLREYLQ